MKSRSQGLRRILDDDKFPPACDRSEPIHVAEPAIQVNRNDRPRPRSNCPFKGLHVHIEVVADVDQNRSRANVHYRGDRGRERMSDRNYLITSSDASRDQGKVQGVISTVDANRVADTDIVGQMTLEAAELAAEIGADAAAPMHWDMFAWNPGDPSEFVGASQTTVIVPRHGRPFVYTAPGSAR